MLGIDVVIVGSGAVATPIWYKADNSPAHLVGTIWQEAFRAFTNVMVKDGRKSHLSTSAPSYAPR